MSLYDIERDGIGNYVSLTVPKPDGQNVVDVLSGVVFLAVTYDLALLNGSATYPTNEDNVPISAKISLLNDRRDIKYWFGTIGLGKKKNIVKLHCQKLMIF